MKNGKMHIVIFISAQNTPRVYLNLLKEYLQEHMAKDEISYMISQYDDTSFIKRMDARLEIDNIQETADLLISFEGYVGKKLFSQIKAKKMLIYVPEMGKPVRKTAYLAGYDYLLLKDTELIKSLSNAAFKQNVKIISNCEDIFSNELCAPDKVRYSREILLTKYPQIDGKRIISFLTKGICGKKYIRGFEEVDYKDVLKKLPDDVILITNCRCLLKAGEQMRYEYINKFVFVEQCDLINILRTSDWILSNIGIMMKCSGAKYAIWFNNNKFEKYMSTVSGQNIYVDEKLAEKLLSIILNDAGNSDFVESNNLQPFHKLLSDLMAK